MRGIGQTLIKEFLCPFPRFFVVLTMVFASVLDSVSIVKKSLDSNLFYDSGSPKSQRSAKTGQLDSLDGYGSNEVFYQVGACGKF